MRLRPTLYFEESHADIYVDRLDKAIQEVKAGSNYIFYDRDCSFINDKQAALHKHSIENRDQFWGDEAKKIHWFKQPETVVDMSDEYLHRWFPDGKINLAYNCLDRNVE